MSPYTILIVEKRSVLDHYHAQLARAFPRRSLLAFPLNYLGLYEFSYPRGLAMRDYPYVGDPQWRERADAGMTFYWLSEAGVAKTRSGHFSEWLRGAREVVFAADPDATAAVAFNTLLSEAVSPRFAQRAHPALFLPAFDEGTFEKTVRARSSTRDDWFQSALKAGIAKRTFEYCFNVNSLALINPVLRANGVPQTFPGLTKFALQLLWSMKDKEPMDVGDILKNMRHWEGSGRYPATSLGSPASAHLIVTELTNAKLLDVKEQTLSISDVGRAVLCELHPDTRDPDLPARLQSWQADWPASRIPMDRYLRTFFGKQKRFAS